MSVPIPVEYITEAALFSLPEYSCTIPSGTTIGKRWRAHSPYRRSCENNKPCEHWTIGEYTEHPNPHRVGIRWTRAVIGEPPPKIVRPAWSPETD